MTCRCSVKGPISRAAPALARSANWVTSRAPTHIRRGPALRRDRAASEVGDVESLTDLRLDSRSIAYTQNIHQQSSSALPGRASHYGNAGSTMALLPIGWERTSTLNYFTAKAVDALTWAERPAMIWIPTRLESSRRTSSFASPRQRLIAPGDNTVRSDQNLAWIRLLGQATRVCYKLTRVTGMALSLTPLTEGACPRFGPPCDSSAPGAEV